MLLSSKGERLESRHFSRTGEIHGGGTCVVIWRILDPKQSQKLTVKQAFSRLCLSHCVCIVWVHYVGAPDYTCCICGNHLQAMQREEHNLAGITSGYVLQKLQRGGFMYMHIL